MPSQAEEDEKIKQREKASRVAAVPNLASRIGAAPVPSATPSQQNVWASNQSPPPQAPPAAAPQGNVWAYKQAPPPPAANPWTASPSSTPANSAAPAKMTQQEQDLMMKQREREARAASCAAPNLANMVNDSPMEPGAQAAGPAGQAVAPAAPAPAVPRKMTQQEQDLMIKQREREARGIATSARAAVVPNLAAQLGEAPATAAPAAAGSPWGATAANAPPPAAKVPTKMTQQEQDLRMKQREREARGIATSARAAVVPNLASQLGIVAVEPSMMSPDLNAGPNVGEAVTVGGGDVDRQRDDALAKSRGRRVRRSGEAKEEAPQILPGATSVASGQAQTREKFVLTAQPEQGGLQELIVPDERENLDDAAEKEAPEPDVEAAGGDDGDDDVNTAPVGTVDVALEAVTAERATAVESVEKIEETGSQKSKWIMIGVAVLLVIIVAVAVGVKLAGDGGGQVDPGPNPGVTHEPTSPPTSERFKAIEPLLADVISSAESFKDYSSPQYQALVWVSDQDKLSDTEDIEKLNVRYILAVFYYSMNGPNWLDSSDWLDGELDECAWQRLECDQSGLVTDITEGADVNIKGKLPSELQHLVALGKSSP